MNKLISKYKEYVQLLSDELNEVVSMVAVHGWRSTRYEDGKKLRDELAELEANPHLLQEDGEKEPDWQGEAEKIFNTHVGSVEPKALYSAAAITALTEALQQGYERGSKEAEGWYEKYGNAITEIAELQQQLAEKDKNYKELLKFAQNKEVSNLRIESELTAAKADHEINVASTARIDIMASVPTVIVTIEILNISKRMLVINTEGKSMPVAYTDTLTIERKIEL